MIQETLPLLLPRQTEGEEKGPWTEQPHGLASNNVLPHLPPLLSARSTHPSPAADSVQLPVYLILSVSDRSQVETEPVPQQQKGGEAGEGVCGGEGKGRR